MTPQRILRRATAALLAAALAGGSAWAEPASTSFVDPLDTAAVRVREPATKTVNGFAEAGARVIGVGLRGLIIASDDRGATWRQIDSPVQSDLTAVTFADAHQGWAVGHDGIILHTGDGGLHWQRQLDGRDARQRFTDDYRRRIAAGEPGLEPFLSDLERNYAKGPALPYLDVCFSDVRNGFAVGSFGTISATTDGGATWRPWADHVDNPGFLNLNAIRLIGKDWIIVGEKGSVFKLDPASGRFRRTDTGYGGSFFGIVGGAGRLYAYGLRGTIYSSGDGGDTWRAGALPVAALISAGTTLADGRVVLVTVAGQAWVSRPGADGFEPLPVAQPDMLTSVLAPDATHLLLGGLHGARQQALAGPSAAH